MGEFGWVRFFYFRFVNYFNTGGSFIPVWVFFACVVLYIEFSFLVRRLFSRSFIRSGFT